METVSHRERVVVTGIGTVNALASDTPGFSEALRSGRCGIGPLTLFATEGYRTANGGEVRGFTPPTALPPSIPLRRTSRADRFALAATLEALARAGLAPLPEAFRQETGVVIGGGAGGLLEAEELFRDTLRRGGRAVRFSRLAAVSGASTANLLATAFCLSGPKTTLMTACSSGATAIGLARDLIRTGQARVMIAGGVEPLCQLTFSAFNALQALDPEPCRPFSGDRAGLSLGEGAGILVLESLGFALARGARILGEVLGYGVTCDAHHMTAPDASGSGAIRAMRAALADAGLAPEAVDYIHAHGTATPLNDLMETRAIKEVFGPRARRLPVSSTKAMTGHTLGAAGALGAVVSLLAIDEGFIPPTIRCRTADAECDLDYVTEGARRAEPGVVLCNAFAFGGNNTTVILGRYGRKGERDG